MARHRQRPPSYGSCHERVQDGQLRHRGGAGAASQDRAEGPEGGRGHASEAQEPRALVRHQSAAQEAKVEAVGLATPLEDTMSNVLIKLRAVQE